jgi:hypothetical protein
MAGRIGLFCGEQGYWFKDYYENPFPSPYIPSPYYKLVEWIDPDTLDFSNLCRNPCAISFLSEPHNFYKINWNILSGNPNAIQLINNALEQYPEKINWSQLSGNPGAISLLERHIDKIDWLMLSGNPGAISLLERHIDKIDWYRLSGNPSAIALLEQYPDKINWVTLSKNPEAIHLISNALEHHPEKINWHFLSMNYKAIHLIEKELEKPSETPSEWGKSNKIDWGWLAENPNAIHLIRKKWEQTTDHTILLMIYSRVCKNPNLRQLLKEMPGINIDIELFMLENARECDFWGLFTNPNAIHLICEIMQREKINRGGMESEAMIPISSNPSIFTYDYDKMRARCLIFKEDIIKNRFHPKNIHKFTSWGYEDFSDFEDNDYYN